MREKFEICGGSRWEHFSHMADLGVRGHGANLEEAFEQAAVALTAVIVDPTEVSASQPVSFECSAPDLELLLTDWLNALIYEMATRKMLFSRFEVKLDGTRLKATAWGEAVDRQRHQPAVEAKGATYTELKVIQEKDGSWIAQCVIDV
jgi:SHS2 domain-containing protein